MDGSFSEFDAPHSGPHTTTLVKSIRRQLASARRRHRIRRDIALLMDFNDRMLADIGLSCGDVIDAVRHGRLARGDNERAWR